jgi:GTP cyclohydrolase-4
MSDIHDIVPDLKINISRVGAESVKLILKTNRKDGLNIVYPSLNMYVNLPFNKKGVHISRNLESLNEVLSKIKEIPIRYLENFCAKITRILLKKHKYSSIAEVDLKSDYYISRKAPASNNLSDESCSVFASAIANKYGDRIRIRKFIGAEILGLTYCPCLLEGLKEENREYLAQKMNLSSSKVNEILDQIPIASHNQRCEIYVLVETSNKIHIDVDDLIQILESCTSAPTYSLLKREDEMKVIKNAYRKPMFVEDVLREISFKIIEKYPDLPDHFLINIRVVSNESVHKYNIISENKTNIGRLKKDLGIK